VIWKLLFRKLNPISPLLRTRLRSNQVKARFLGKSAA
jgi:hypothetical protein